MAKDKRSEEEIQKRDQLICLRYMIGEGVDTIVDRFGISTRTLYAVLRKNNIPLKMKEKETREAFRKEILLRVVRDNQTFEQIAREKGMPIDIITGYGRYELKRLQVEKERKKAKVKAHYKKSLKKDGLKGDFPAANRIGMEVTETEEDREKRERYVEGEMDVPEGDLGEAFGNDDVSGDKNSLSEFSKEDVKLALLRELLRHAATVTGMEDYSNDPLLDKDYLLPVDIIIMKDIVARSAEGESAGSIAQTHRTDEDIVKGVLAEKYDRKGFRDRFIRSLVKRGLIQL